MVGWAIVQKHIGQKVNKVDFSSSPLIEGLQIESLSAIKITDKEGQTTTLNRQNGAFVVAEKGNYPADITKINDLINNCLDIRTNEKVTDNPENYADLGLTDKTAHCHIAFLDSDGNEVVGLFLSERGEKGGAFARLLSGKGAYSIQSLPWIKIAPMDYINSEPFGIDNKQITSVTVNTGNDSYVLKTSDDKSTVELQDMPEGKQYKETVYKTVFGALTSFRFEDVVNVANAPESLSFDSTYTCRLDDKTVYKLSLAKKDDKVYAKISADYLDKSQVQISQDDSKEQLKEKESKLLAMDAVKAFNQKHQNWIYEVPSYQAGNLNKSLSELVEDIPKSESETESDAAKTETVG